MGVPLYVICNVKNSALIIVWPMVFYIIGKEL